MAPRPGVDAASSVAGCAPAGVLRPAGYETSWRVETAGYAPSLGDAAARPQPPSYAAPAAQRNGDRHVCAAGRRAEAASELAGRRLGHTHGTETQQLLSRHTRHRDARQRGAAGALGAKLAGTRRSCGHASQLRARVARASAPNPARARPARACGAAGVGGLTPAAAASGAGVGGGTINREASLVMRHHY